MFPTKKFITSLIVLAVVLMLLKWSVDVCLPNSEGSQVFLKYLDAPDFLCKPISSWDRWARERAARAQAQRNFFNPGPTALQNEEGEPDLFLFGKDLLKFTVVLARVPRDRFALFEVLTILLVFSVIFSILWESLEWLFATAFAFKERPAPEAEPSPMSLPIRNDPTRTILPSYLTEKSSLSNRKPSARSSSSNPTIIESSINESKDGKNDE